MDTHTYAHTYTHTHNTYIHTHTHTHTHTHIYSEAVAGYEGKKFKLLLRSKDSQTPDEIKRLLKSKVNPAEIKVGNTSLRLLRDRRVTIEAASKKEIETLGEKIGEQCGNELEVKVQRLRNPRLVLLNIPDDTTLENVGETLTQQNLELGLKEVIIDSKFCYTTKRGTRNLVIEVDSGTRHKLPQPRVKMGWAICKIDGYIVAKRCFRYIRYNHNYRESKGVETYPL